MFRVAPIAALALLLSLQGACGFQLRGSLTMPAELQRTYIDAADRHSLFYRELRRELIAAGVDVVASTAESTAVFSIYFDETSQRVLSVSARNVPTEYEVYYTIRYGVRSDESVLLDVQDLTLTRDYTYDSTLVLGKAREEQSLRNAIVRDLVRIVLKQVSAQ